jgi:ribosomal protein S18 acetylase RimI-like enzyme
VRLADARDVPVLRAMLYEAFAWRGDSRFPPLDEALALPEVGRYVDEWGRGGDLGVIADGDIGAAWIRLFTEDDHGYGFVAPDVPELSIAVARDERGHGAGTALLGELLVHAAAAGHRAVSLSVATDNPAVRLYERFGFARVGYVGTSWTMQRILD